MSEELRTGTNQPAKESLLARAGRRVLRAIEGGEDERIVAYGGSASYDPDYPIYTDAEETPRDPEVEDAIMHFAAVAVHGTDEQRRAAFRRAVDLQRQAATTSPVTPGN